MVADEKLRARFPRTQRAIREAIGVVDASILFDNSGSSEPAFPVCRVQVGRKPAFDARDETDGLTVAARRWLDVVRPL